VGETKAFSRNLHAELPRGWRKLPRNSDLFSGRPSVCNTIPSMKPGGPPATRAWIGSTAYPANPGWGGEPGEADRPMVRRGHKGCYPRLDIVCRSCNPQGVVRLPKNNFFLPRSVRSRGRSSPRRISCGTLESTAVLILAGCGSLPATPAGTPSSPSLQQAYLDSSLSFLPNLGVGVGLGKVVGQTREANSGYFVECSSWPGS
jgi:hypothetical protein